MADPDAPALVTREFLLLTVGGFSFFFSFFLLLPVLPLYARAVGVRDDMIGVVIGSFALAAMIGRPWAGWAADRYGRKPLLIAGAVLFLCASAAYASAGTVVSLLLVRMLHGAGMSLYPTAASAVVADLAPPARRGEAMGFYGAASNVALAGGPLLGVALSERVGSIGTFAVSAAIAACAVGFAFAVREPLLVRRADPFRLATTVSRATLLPSVVMFCLMVTYGVQVAFLPLYAVATGENPGVFFLVFALVVAVVRGHAGRMSDRVGRARVSAFGLLVASAALGVIAASPSALVLALAGGLYGIGFGCAQPSLMAWSVDDAGPADRGKAMGTLYTALELGIALGAMTSGVGVARAGFTATFGGAALVALVGFFTAAAGRRA